MRSVLLVLLLVSAARAQETIAPSDLAGRSWGSREGKLLSVEGKFLGLENEDEVRLSGIGARKLVVDLNTPEGDALAADLAGFRKGALDRHGRSNVRVVGIARDAGEGRVLVVTRVEKLADDGDRWKALAARPGADVAAVASAALAAARASKDESLAEWARATLEGTIDKRSESAKDAPSAILVARDYRDLAHVTSKAVAVLAPHSSDPAARALLDELGAVQYRDRWLTKEQLRTELGLVLVDGKWMTALHAELLEEIKKERSRERLAGLRTLSSTLYQKSAEKRELAQGMNKPEAAASKGFPVSVDRVTDERGVSWDLWVLGDGTHAYFSRQPGDEALLYGWR